MVMLVYKNASLTREEIRDRCAEGSWDVFNKYLQQTQPLNNGKLGFYYTENEILPPLPGICLSYSPFHAIGLSNML
jgi:xylulokinase